MATSDTVAFRPDVEEIIAEAFERCGIDPQTQTGYKAVSARRSLNLLFSEWANRGINYWAVEQRTLTLVKDQTTVSIADYNQLPNKTSSGKPSQYMLDKQYTPLIYIWQIPDVTTYSLNYWSVNQLDDITASNQDADVPYRWSDCICAGLASKLALKNAPDRFQVLNEIYERAFTFAAASDNDGVSLRVQPTALNLY
jgi:hypothetical protein